MGRTRDERALVERLYSIKEASELPDVSVHTLRFWERKLPGYLAPVRTPAGYRRYTEQWLEKIRRLDFFVHKKGLTLIGARRMIEEGRNPEDMEPTIAEVVLKNKRVLPLPSWLKHKSYVRP